MLLNSLWASRLVLVAALSLAIATASRGEDLRTWTDSTGQFDLQAKFVSVEDGVVNLIRENGAKMKIALDKLSRADQEYVAGLISAGPLEASGDSSTMSEEPTTGPVYEGAREVTVNWDRARKIAIIAGGSGWSIVPGAADTAGFRARSVELPENDRSSGKFNGVAVNIVAKRAVVGYKVRRKLGRMEGSSRIVMCDIESGQTIASATGLGEMTPLAVHDDGERILMRQDGSGMRKANRLEMWSIEGEVATPSLILTLHSTGHNLQREVIWAEFVDATTLVTCSRWGQVVLWDLVSAQPICQFQTIHGAVPAISGDRKWISFCSKDKMGLFDIENRAMAGVQDTPVTLEGPRMAFSPSGSKIGCIAKDRILVWDTATGRLEQNFTTTGVRIEGAVDFPDDRFILGGKQFLISLDTQLKLWRYQGVAYAHTVGGTTFLLVADSHGPRMLAAAKLPHAAASSLLDEVTRQPDLFVFRKGTPVKLNVAGIKSAQRKRVSDALTEKLSQMGCPIQFDAALEVVATVEGPTQKKILYGPRGQYDVQEYCTRVKFIYQGTPIWQTSGTNIPYFFAKKDGEDLKETFRKAGLQPNYSFYDSVVLPEYLQGPSANRGTGGGQTLGQCRVTPKGFR